MWLKIKSIKKQQEARPIVKSDTSLTWTLERENTAVSITSKGWVNCKKITLGFPSSKKFSRITQPRCAIWNQKLMRSARTSTSNVTNTTNSWSRKARKKWIMMKIHLCATHISLSRAPLMLTESGTFTKGRMHGTSLCAAAEVLKASLDVSRCTSISSCPRWLSQLLLITSSGSTLAIRRLSASLDVSSASF